MHSIVKVYPISTHLRLLRSPVSEHTTTIRNVVSTVGAIDYYQSTEFIEAFITNPYVDHICKRMQLYPSECDKFSRLGKLCSISADGEIRRNPIKFVEDIMLMISNDDIFPLELFAALYGHPNVDAYYFMHDPRNMTYKDLHKIDRYVKSWYNWFSFKTMCVCIYSLMDNLGNFIYTAAIDYSDQSYYRMYYNIYIYLLFRVVYDYCFGRIQHLEASQIPEFLKKLAIHFSNRTRKSCLFGCTNCYTSPINVIKLIKYHKEKMIHMSDESFGSLVKAEIAMTGIEYIEMPIAFKKSIDLIDYLPINSEQPTAYWLQIPIPVYTPPTDLYIAPESQYAPILLSRFRKSRSVRVVSVFVVPCVTMLFQKFVMGIPSTHLVTNYSMSDTLDCDCLTRDDGDDEDEDIITRESNPHLYADGDEPIDEEELFKFFDVPKITTFAT
jgi:hypothetical protein